MTDRQESSDDFKKSEQIYEVVRLGSTRVSECLDPYITDNSESDRYHILADIARDAVVKAYAQESGRTRATLSEALDELLDCSTPRTRQLLIDALKFLAFAVEFIGAQARELASCPIEGDLVLVDDARSVVFMLMVQAIRVAREVHWLLTGGFPSAALARWRTLHELAVTSATIVDSQDPDMPRRYREHVRVLKAKLVKVSHAHGFLSGAVKDEFKRSLADSWDVNQKDDYAWAVDKQSPKKASGGFATLERSAGLESFRPFYKIANSSVHADAASLFLSIPRGEASPIGGALASGFYLPVHLTLSSLRIVQGAFLLSTARREDGERVVGLGHYIQAVICSAELSEHCEELFSLYEDALSE